MKSLLTYYGGKQKLAPIIHEILPSHILYAEPFAGGAAVFWYKRPSPVEVLNDLNGELINFYRIVKTRYHDLYTLISQTLHSRQQHTHAWVIYQFPELFDDVQRAWAIWVLSSQSFSARLDGSFGYDVSQNTTSRKIQISRHEFTERYATRLEKVQLENADALYIIRSRDSPGSLFYCDPPYFNSDMGHYKGYTKRDFADLLSTLAGIQGKFLLSSYPSHLLSDFTRRHQWYQQSFEMEVTVNAKSGKTKPKTEVLTANYPLQKNIQQLLLFGNPSD